MAYTTDSLSPALADKLAKICGLFGSHHDGEVTADVASVPICDAKGRSCKGRHELVQSKPQPICYPEQVTPAMMSDWRRQHSK